MSMHPLQPRNRAGMTLLELTVGLVVTGLVVAAGYAAFTTIIDRREHAAVAAAETAHAAGLRQQLMQWMDGSIARVPQTITDPQTALELTFYTRARTPIQSPLTSVRLFIDDGSSGLGGGLVAVLRPSQGNDSMRVMLDPDVRGMSVRYLIPIDGIRQWVTVEAVQSNTPVGIRLSLTGNTPEMAAALALPIEAPTQFAR